ncbi:uncharacterized protein [Diadema setosum]|uniref:uncharacterized protein n=1 Tax=Diadema setosum TaxID=31175 RepID=UPI003B3A081A
MVAATDDNMEARQVDMAATPNDREADPGDIAVSRGIGVTPEEFVTFEEEPMDTSDDDNFVAQSQEDSLSTLEGNHKQPLNFPPRNEEQQGPMKAKTRQTFEAQTRNSIHKHPMLPPCSCRARCKDKISHEERTKIWEKFWSLSYNRRRDWISNNVRRVPKSVIKNSESESRRTCTLLWKIGEIKVCKSFFLSTLGYRNDKVVQFALSNVNEIPTSGVIIGTEGDKRGLHEPSNKYSEEYRQQVIDHIESFRPQVSHYKCDHAPHRRYLPSELTVRHMHLDFCEQVNHTCSYTYYRTIFKSCNISFAVPSSDLCQKCEEHKQYHKDGPQEHQCEDCTCEECLMYHKHRERANQARKAMEDDCAQMEEDNNILVVTADMQKAITMPKLPSKDHFFAKKLVLFNETFASPTRTGPKTCIVWHEGEAGRKASNLASSYLHFIKGNRDKEHVIIYSDNCCSQNKNWTLFSAFVRVVNDPSLAVQVLTMKYLEPGHTYMAADSIHGSITKKFNNRSAIHDFGDFVDVMQSSRKDMTCQAIDHTSMYLFEDQSRKVGKFRLRDARVVQFRRGSLNLFAKSSHEELCFKEIDFLKKGPRKEMTAIMTQRESLLDNVTTMALPRGISQSKKDELLKLVRAVPQHKKRFFENLPVNDQAADLEVEFDH